MGNIFMLSLTNHGQKVIQRNHEKEKWQTANSAG
jgi:hypothetical protein